MGEPQGSEGGARRDNIQDFPGQTQELAGKDDAAFADFGSKFFTLPNPMYGSWEKNPQN